MTIALRVAGTHTSATAAVTAVNPAVGAGATATDLSVLFVTAKPFGTTVTTPTGWIKIAEVTNGTVATTANDVGSTKALMYVKVGAAVGAIGNLAQTGADVLGAVINTYSTTLGSWDISSFTTGVDSTSAANYSATGGTWPSAVAAGDWVVAGTAVSGDIGTPSAWTIAGMAGATLGTFTSRTNFAITTSFDARTNFGDRPVTAGSSTAAPTFTYTNASATAGSTIWLRLREFASLPKVATLTDTFDTEDTVKWAGYADANVAAINGAAQIEAAPAYPTLYTNARYDLLESRVFIDVDQVPNVSNGSTEGYLIAQASIGNEVGIFLGGGELIARVKTATVNADFGWTAHNPATMRFWSIREAGGIVYFEYSADGSSWTVLHSQTAPFGLSSVLPLFMSGNYAAAPTPGALRVASINILPSVGSLPPTSIRVTSEAVHRAALY